MSTNRWLLSVVTFLLAFCLASPSPAQQVTAAINGVVTDPTGSQVANARVTATDLDRGTILSTQTGTNGSFEIPTVPVGTYNVKVEQAGFHGPAVESHFGP